VLIVEDEADIRELLSEYFRARTFDVVGAADGRAALLAIERDPDRFSLVITDLHLPGVDGLAVLRAARGRVDRLVARVNKGELVSPLFHN